MNVSPGSAEKSRGAGASGVRVSFETDMMKALSKRLAFRSELSNRDVTYASVWKRTHLWLAVDIFDVQGSDREVIHVLQISGCGSITCSLRHWLSLPASPKRCPRNIHCRQRNPCFHVMSDTFQRSSLRAVFAAWHSSRLALGGLIRQNSKLMFKNGNQGR